MIRAVLLDAVGTVLYPDPPVESAYHSWGSRFGSRLTEAEIRTRFRRAWGQRAAPLASADPGEISRGDDGRTSEELERRRWRQIVEEVFHDLPGAGGELFESLWRHFARGEHWRVYPDAAVAWRELEARGFLVGLASNFDQRLAEVCRALAPLSSCQRIFYSSAVGFVKPDRRFFASVQRHLELDAREILLVGDDWHNDYQGALAAGWRACLVARDASSDRPEALRSLLELPGVLDQRG